MESQDSNRGASRGPETESEDGLAAQIERLTARCHELEETLRIILDNLPIVAWRTDREGVFDLHDGKGLAAAGLRPGEYLGRRLSEVYPNIDLSNFRRALAGEELHDGAELRGASWESWTCPSRDPRGEIRGVIGVTLHTTEYRRAERELRTQLEVVERQRKVIEDLSTPILQVWEGVLALPMIGVIDSVRTAEVMDDLLDAVSRQHARFAILDLTGVEAVDTSTAAYLIDLVRAIQLLGAEGVITGIRPSVAQTVVAIGVDLGSITTLANLQAGLRYCITQMRRK